jgi:hypothetical protein
MHWTNLIGEGGGLGYLMCGETENESLKSFLVTPKRVVTCNLEGGIGVFKVQFFHQT